MLANCGLSGDAAAAHPSRIDPAKTMDRWAISGVHDCQKSIFKQRGPTSALSPTEPLYRTYNMREGGREATIYASSAQSTGHTHASKLAETKGEPPYPRRRGRAAEAEPPRAETPCSIRPVDCNQHQTSPEKATQTKT